MILVPKLKVCMWYVCAVKVNTKGLKICMSCLLPKNEGLSLDSLAPM